MKAIILARVSSEDQDSNPAQIARLRDFAESKGFSDVTVHEIEESSTKADRNKFQEIVSGIRKSKDKVALFVDTVDRLQRSFQESVVFDQLRREAKVELYFYRENLHIHAESNSADLIRWDMGVMFARSYVLQLSDNVKRRFEQKRRQGEWTAGAPFGYASVMVDEKKRLRSDIVPHPVNAAYVQKMFEFYASGHYSGRKIADWLNAQDIRTNRGARFYLSTVHYILKNPFYHGEMRSMYGMFPHKYAPLVSKPLFHAVQELLETRNQNPQRSIRRHEFALSGLVKCARCGCSITPEIKKQRYVYYSCTNAKRTCRRRYVNEDRLLKPVHAAFMRLKLSDRDIDEIIAYLKNHHLDASSRNRADRQRLQQLYNAAREQRDRLIDLTIRKQISQDEFERKMHGLGIAQDDLGKLLRAPSIGGEKDYITAGHVLSAAQRAAEIFDSSEPTQKRQLLEDMLQNSLLNEQKLEFELQSPFDTVASVYGRPIMLRDLEAFRKIDWKAVAERLRGLGFT